VSNSLRLRRFRAVSVTPAPARAGGLPAPAVPAAVDALG
jgi:hypothetical protein